MDINKEIINALKSVRSRNICIKEKQECKLCIFKINNECRLNSHLDKIIDYFERNYEKIEPADIDSFSTKTLLEQRKIDDKIIIKQIVNLIIDANSENLNYVTLKYNINDRVIAYFEIRGFKVNNKDFDQRDETEVMISWGL
jgi:hypothetical protein